MLALTPPPGCRLVCTDLCLTPDLVAATFRGQVTITVDVKSEATEVQLNANELEVQHARITLGDEQVAATSVTFNKELERLTVAFGKPIPAGEHKLQVEFTGILNDKMAGFYRSEYTNAKGEKRLMAVTQFEATDARRSFPCWDEPAVKATFKVCTLRAVNRHACSCLGVVFQDRARRP